MDIKYAYTGLDTATSARLSAQRRLMTELVGQETTGLVAPTYAGISDRSLTLTYQQKIAENDSRQSVIATIDTRLELVGSSLEGLSSLSSEVGGALGQNGFQLTSDGKTPEQATALNALEGYVSTLDNEIGGTYLFGGRATDAPPVVDVSTMLHGDGSRDGFETVAAQRLAADRGADGMGRLGLTASGTTLTLASDGDHPFGMKVASTTSTLTDVTIAGPSGSPPALTIDVGGQPNLGETLSVMLTLPDGSTETIALEAGTKTDGDAGTFAIGATAADTAVNLQAALRTALGKVASTDLVAASAVQAADDFFDTAGGATPMRVDGPPYESATALRAATAADTVIWYTGTNDAASARLDAHARVDEGQTVNYGTRANEVGITSQIKALAVVATLDLSAGGATEKAIYASMVDRTQPSLQANSRIDGLQTIAAEIAGARKAAAMASDRLTTTSNIYQTAVDETMAVDTTELAVKLTTLSTQIEASYKATSLLYKLTLTDFI